VTSTLINRVVIINIYFHNFILSAVGGNDNMVKKLYLGSPLGFLFNLLLLLCPMCKSPAPVRACLSERGASGSRQKKNPNPKVEVFLVTLLFNPQQLSTGDFVLLHEGSALSKRPCEQRFFSCVLNMEGNL
jgi:hypothetical protein